MHVHAGANVWVRRPAAGAATSGAASSEWLPAVVAAADDGAGAAMVTLDGGEQLVCPLSDMELRADDSSVQVGGADLVLRARRA